ncbi:MAG: sel1 repeat family protein [Magnetococcales bacterium]|nr:sel1 repeat family protein [Magnetococcales bacterium]
MIETSPLSRRVHGGAAGTRLAKVLTILLALGTATGLATSSLALAADPQPGVAAPSANPEEDFKAGRTAYENNDWFAAIPPLRRSAMAGHMPAMVMLGTIQARAEESAEALLWYHKAAEAGSLDGAYWLGTMLLNELETPATETKGAKPDKTVVHGPEEALKWLTRAATGNHPPAMFALSNVYLHGKLGQHADPKTALDWLQRAADKGFTPAMKELAAAYTRGLLGLAPNPKESQRWEKAVQDAENANAKSEPKTAKPNQGTTKK